MQTEGTVSASAPVPSTIEPGDLGDTAIRDVTEVVEKWRSAMQLLAAVLAQTGPVVIAPVDYQEAANFVRFQEVASLNPRMYVDDPMGVDPASMLLLLRSRHLDYEGAMANREEEVVRAMLAFTNSIAGIQSRHDQIRFYRGLARAALGALGLAVRPAPPVREV